MHSRRCRESSSGECILLVLRARCGLTSTSCNLGASDEKQQCKDLGDRCVSLLVAIRDSYEGMEGPAAPQILEQADPCVDFSDAS